MRLSGRYHPPCAECGHSYFQHEKATSTGMDFCEMPHCPCLDYIPVKVGQQWYERKRTGHIAEIDGLELDHWGQWNVVHHAVATHYVRTWDGKSQVSLAYFLRSYRPFEPDPVQESSDDVSENKMNETKRLEAVAAVHHLAVMARASVTAQGALMVNKYEAQAQEALEFQYEAPPVVDPRQAADRILAAAKAIQADADALGMGKSQDRKRGAMHCRHCGQQIRWMEAQGWLVVGLKDEVVSRTDVCPQRPEDPNLGHQIEEGIDL